MGSARASNRRIATVAVATSILLAIIIMVALPYIALARTVEYIYSHHAVRHPRVPISEAYQTLKTGDILMHLSHLPSNSNLTHQAFFSHVSMLMREGDLIYTSEAQTGTELMPNADRPGTDYYMARGAASAPLLTRLKFASDTVYVMRLSHPLDPTREERLKATADQLHRVQYPYPTACQALTASLLARGDIPARHCFQHVAYLVDTAGLTPLDQEPPLAKRGFFQVCRDISDLPGRALPDGYYYTPPVELIYDIRLPGTP